MSKDRCGWWHLQAYCISGNTRVEKVKGKAIPCSGSTSSAAFRSSPTYSAAIYSCRRGTSSARLYEWRHRLQPRKYANYSAWHQWTGRSPRVIRSKTDILDWVCLLMRFKLVISADYCALRMVFCSCGAFLEFDADVIVLQTLFTCCLDFTNPGPKVL